MAIQANILTANTHNCLRAHTSVMPVLNADDGYEYAHVDLLAEVGYARLPRHLRRTTSHFNPRDCCLAPLQYWALRRMGTIPNYWAADRHTYNQCDLFGPCYNLGGRFWRHWVRDQFTEPRTRDVFQLTCLQEVACWHGGKLCAVWGRSSMVHNPDAKRDFYYDAAANQYGGDGYWPYFYSNWYPDHDTLDCPTMRWIGCTFYPPRGPKEPRVRVVGCHTNVREAFAEVKRRYAWIEQQVDAHDRVVVLGDLNLSPYVVGALFEPLGLKRAAGTSIDQIWTKGLDIEIGGRCEETRGWTDHGTAWFAKGRL